MHQRHRLHGHTIGRVSRLRAADVPGNLSNTNGMGMGQVIVDLGPVVKTKTGTLFYPFTTTLIEIILNREPMPLDKVSDVCWILPET